uniref:Uncharacterized protein n=1 Tax=Arion vulgaris TaxID=1028688 RepID=A0A0B7BRZ3_9EUPU
MFHYIWEGTPVSWWGDTDKKKIRQAIPGSEFIMGECKKKIFYSERHRYHSFAAIFFFTTYNLSAMNKIEPTGQGLDM